MHYFIDVIIYNAECRVRKLPFIILPSFCPNILLSILFHITGKIKSSICFGPESASLFAHSSFSLQRAVIAGPYMNTYRPRDVTGNPVTLSTEWFYKAISASLP
jgi:hypothetical protein